MDTEFEDCAVSPEKESPEMVSLTFRVPVSLRTKIEELATIDGVDRSFMARELLAKGVLQKQQELAIEVDLQNKRLINQKLRSQQGE